MSENATSAVNQQGSRLEYKWADPSETTRRAPVSRKLIEAYLLGAIHDGTLNKKKRFRISQKGTKWLNLLRNLFYEIGYNSWIYKEGKNRDVNVLETLAGFLDMKFNPKELRTMEEKRFYIRGFFDAEGGVPKDKDDRFYIQLTQKDKVKLLWIKKSLSELAIKTGKIHNPSVRIDPDYWRIYVLASSQNDFMRKIGSWHPRKIRIFRNRTKI